MGKLSAPEKVSLGSTLEFKGEIGGDWISVAGGLKPPTYIGILEHTPDTSCYLVSGGFRFEVPAGKSGYCKVKTKVYQYVPLGIVASIYGSSDVEGVLRFYREGEDTPIHEAYFSGKLFGGVVSVPIGSPKPSSIILEASFENISASGSELTVAPIVYSIVGSPEEFAIMLQASNSVILPVKLRTTLLSESSRINVRIRSLVLERSPDGYARVLIIIPPHVSKISDEVAIEYGQPAYPGSVSASAKYYAHKPLVYVFDVEAEVVYAYSVPSTASLYLHLFSADGIPFSTRLFDAEVVVDGNAICRNNVGLVAELLSALKQVTGFKTMKVTATWRLRHGVVPDNLSMMVSYGSVPVFFVFKPPPPFTISISAPSTVNSGEEFSVEVSETAIADLGQHFIAVSMFTSESREAVPLEFSAKNSGESESMEAVFKAPEKEGYITVTAYDPVVKIRASKIIRVV